jgi:hypothetical protein
VVCARFAFCVYRLFASVLRERFRLIINHNGNWASKSLTSFFFCKMGFGRRVLVWRNIAYGLTIGLWYLGPNPR